MSRTYRSNAGRRSVLTLRLSGDTVRRKPVTATTFRGRELHGEKAGDGNPFDNHRSTPLAAMAPLMQGLEAGDVDYLWLWDELSGWFPGDLWTERNTPAAAFMEPNSTYDPFVQAAYPAEAEYQPAAVYRRDPLRPSRTAPQDDVAGQCDDRQHGLAIGAGELRQTRPFGYKRSEGPAVEVSVGLLDMTGLVEGPAAAADGFRRGVEVLGNFKGPHAIR